MHWFLSSVAWRKRRWAAILSGQWFGIMFDVCIHFYPTGVTQQSPGQPSNFFHTNYTPFDNNVSCHKTDSVCERSFLDSLTHTNLFCIAVSQLHNRAPHRDLVSKRACCCVEVHLSALLSNVGFCEWCGYVYVNAGVTGCALVSIHGHIQRSMFPSTCKRDKKGVLTRLSISTLASPYIMKRWTVPSCSSLYAEQLLLLLAPTRVFTWCLSGHSNATYPLITF